MNDHTYFVIVETIFCDNECDERVLEEYFQYLLLMCASYNNQHIVKNMQSCLLIYISSDKVKYINKLKHFLNTAGYVDGNIKIVEYEHPSGGYEFGIGSHVDLIKNPNKTYKYRDELFRNALEETKHIDADFIIRTAIDDDDLFPAWHLSNIKNLSEKYKNKNKIVGICMMNALIVYNSLSKAEIVGCQISRAITGNKFWIIPSGLNFKNYSPWGLPDRVQLEKNKNTAKIIFISNKCFGIYYMRRSANLSNYNKSHFLVRKYFELEQANGSMLPTNLKIYDSLMNDNQIHAKDFFCIQATFDNKKNAICFKTNFNQFKGKGDLISYYLYDSSMVRQKLGYSNNDRGQFILCKRNDVYYIKAFVKNLAGTKQTFKSNIVRVM